MILAQLSLHTVFRTVYYFIFSYITITLLAFKLSIIFVTYFKKIYNYSTQYRKNKHTLTQNQCLFSNLKVQEI